MVTGLCSKSSSPQPLKSSIAVKAGNSGNLLLCLDDGISFGECICCLLSLGFLVAKVLKGFVPSPRIERIDQPSKDRLE